MRRWIGPALLAVAVLLSGVMVVVTKHGNRELVSELDGLRGERAALDAEYSQLRIEEGTLAHPGQIEHQAVRDMNMREPAQPVAVEAED